MASQARVETALVAFGDHQTWVRVTHPSKSLPGRLPVVVVHGGPGMAHDYTLPMTALGDDGRRVIHYDQLGCGRSSHLLDAGPEFWTVQLFVEELRNLVAQLDLTGGFHLVGQSWGGMLVPEYVHTHPAGVRSITLADSPASMPLWARGTNQLLEDMPPHIRDAVARHEAAGTFNHPEYLGAVDAFYKRFLCRLDPWPEPMLASFRQLEQDPTVYQTMIGPSEFTITGTLANWSVVDRLSDISVPALVIAGEHDEARPEAYAPFVERLKQVRQHVVDGASHTPHLEFPEEFTRVVGHFLRQHD